jgi:hypothetical protein
VLEELNFGKNFATNVEEGCMRSMQQNLDFGYQLSVSSKTEEMHGKA